MRGLTHALMRHAFSVRSDAKRESSQPHLHHQTNGDGLGTYSECFSGTGTVPAIAHQPFQLIFTPAYSGGRIPLPPAQRSSIKFGLSENSQKDLVIAEVWRAVKGSDHLALSRAHRVEAICFPLLTGNCKFNYHPKTIDGVGNYSCGLCKEARETIELRDCSAVARCRLNYLRSGVVDQNLLVEIKPKAVCNNNLNYFFSSLYKK